MGVERQVRCRFIKRSLRYSRALWRDALPMLTPTSITAISAVNTALTTVTPIAPRWAAQNRLGSTVANLLSMNENTQAARGRIQDVDFAAETAELTKQQTLQQASTTILAQANQLPAPVLKLLQ